MKGISKGCLYTYFYVIWNGMAVLFTTVLSKSGVEIFGLALDQYGMLVWVIEMDS